MSCAGLRTKLFNANWFFWANECTKLYSHFGNYIYTSIAVCKISTCAIFLTLTVKYKACLVMDAK